MFVCTGFQADSANSLNRWTFLKASACRLRVVGRTLNEYSPYSTKPLFAYEYFTHRLGTKMKTMAFCLTSAEVTEFVSRPCYFTIIAITQLKPLWRREAFLYGVYFFRKTLFHLDDHTISNDRIYVLELIFYLR